MLERNQWIQSEEQNLSQEKIIRARPVSYTHLDVYKRQDIELTESLEYDLQKMLEEEEGSFS